MTMNQDDRSRLEQAGQNGAKVKVVAILGRGRSGSTILDNLLGEIDQFFSAGEVHNLFDRGLLQGHTCGCGQPLARCEIWSPILERALGETINPRQIVEWQSELVRPRHLLKLLDPSVEESSILHSYLGVLNRLYMSIADTSETSVIIDSSKRPPHGALLRLLPNVEPYFIQLIRDPRAVAFSRRRAKQSVDRPLRQESAAANALGWLNRNLSSHAVRREVPDGQSLLVRYEDFVAEPRQIVYDIMDMIDEDPASLPFTDSHTAVLTSNHTSSGNPSRFKTGTIGLQNDDRWVREQDLSDRFVTTAMTLPLLLRYGYPVRPSSEADRSVGAP